jgi:DNA-binding LacI/PurR family transcriptional regulator
LTSVDVKFADIGRTACDILLNVRNGNAVAPRTQVAIKGTLCVGGSTVPA